MASELEKAVNKLVQREKGWQEFIPKPQPKITDSAGKAANGVPTTGGSGAKETDYAARTYHPRQAMKSTDGVITWQFDPIKTVSMADSSGSVVVWEFQKPTTNT